MAKFIVLMEDSNKTEGWEPYIQNLLSSGKFRGGSTLGGGVCVRKGQNDTPARVTGIIRLEVENVDAAKALLRGNPAFEAGFPIELLEEIED